MEHLEVDIKQKNIQYDIVFSTDIIACIKEKIHDINKHKFLLVIDETVYRLHKDLLDDVNKQLDGRIFTIASGEEHKNYQTIFQIIDECIDYKVTRNDYLVAIGGGVTGDMVGFASSLFKRGTKLIQVPTTLLSMFDSSVGGKTGIDYKGIKNLVGTFYSADLVIINHKFLQTLPQSEILSGYFEGVKHCILDSKESFLVFQDLYDMLSKKQLTDNIGAIIKKNIEYKLSVVQSDPFELTGRRRILNYGHTFGHALETTQNFQLAHGVCVGFGMIFANILSNQKGLLDTDICEEVNQKIIQYLEGITFCLPDFDDIFTLMSNDKKNQNDQVKFILIQNYGDIIEYNTTYQELKETFLTFNKQLQKHIIN